MTNISPTDLPRLAQEASRQAYVPYSKFFVGTALLCTDGRVFTGCNVENASYGLARCAEQTAIQKMVSEGGRAFTHIAVFTQASPPSSPCGACRQILFEFGPDAIVEMVNHLGESRSSSVRELIPLAFGPSDLE